MKFIFKPALILTFLIFLFNCSSNSNDDCTPVTCLNGGTQTEDCGCDCPEGYSGMDCGTQIAPTHVTISKIRVKKFPDTDNGNWWDTFPANSDADIFVTIENSNGNIIYKHPSYYQNATGLGTTYYDFIPSSPITFDTYTSLYYINLYDYDTGINDKFISTVGWIPYLSSQAGFPATKTIINTQGDFECELTLQYTW